jgi:hypothetical protein
VYLVALYSVTILTNGNFIGNGRSIVPAAGIISGERILMEYTFKADVGGKSLSIQAGKVAKQASGSVVVQYGDTVVLVTAVSANNERDVDFLPLSVEYQEKSMRPAESRAITFEGRSDDPAKRKPSPPV